MFQKPDNMRFVDLAIWIDKNFYTENRDEDTAFKYMYILAYMLSTKAGYFNTDEDYDDFASYLAWSTYQRMVDTNKPPIKSVLNYMKNIMYFRKNSFCRETFSQVIDPEYDKTWNGDLYKEKCMSQLEAENKEIIKLFIIDVVNNIPQLIKLNIPAVYKNDKILFNNIYISVLLTLLSSVTLPYNNYNHIDNRRDKTPAFNDVNYFYKHQNTEIILWQLPDDMQTVIKIILNKVKAELIKDFGDILSDFKLEDDLFDSLHNEVVFGYGNEQSWNQ